MVLKTGPLIRGLRWEHRKGIRAVALVLTVMLTGFFCLSAWAPETDAEKGKAGDASGISSGASDEYTPGVQEQEAPAKVKKKHFPWFWVAAGVVVVGVVLYFTVIKKPEYKLTVSVGPGVSGSPANGTAFYKKGKRVDYSYKFEATYKNLGVYLDGVEVPASGQIKMDRDHTLSAFADESYYDLTVTTTAGVSGTPAPGTSTHREGTSVAYGYAEDAGYRNMNVQIDGVAVPAQGTLLMDRSHALSATAEKVPEEIIQVRDVVGLWRITTVCSTGVKTVGTLRFMKSCEKSHCQRVYWVNLEGGYGFWHYEGEGISFNNSPNCLECICDSRGATELTGNKAAVDYLFDCRGSFSDPNHMSGTFKTAYIYAYGGGGTEVIGTGTWSAYRL